MPERDKPGRARSEPLPITIDEDEASIPMWIPEGVRAPTPPTGSRVRYYPTPAEYAEADQRRLERVVNGAVTAAMHTAIAPLAAEVRANHTATSNRIHEVGTEV